MSLVTQQSHVSALSRIGLLLFLVVSTTNLRAEEQAALFQTPKDLWAGFDPRAEPFDIEVSKAWDEGPIHIEQFYFTAETWEGVKARVFAYRASPIEGKKLPCILHIHGGGQTASLDWIRYWAGRGYVVVSYDFCGNAYDRKPDQVTQWGKVPSNMGDRDKDLPKSSMKPTPRYNQWYHWILAARRAITLLEQHPKADPNRIGVFGISVGGTLTWMVAGCDDRVKAAAPIYGAGQNTYLYPWQTPDDPIDEDNRLWRTLLQCEAYAADVKCPLLFINASNDHHGRLDLVMRTLELATNSKMLREVYTPNYIHHIEPGEGVDLTLWMDSHLKGIGPTWPESPQIRITAADGIPRITVTSDRPEEVEDVTIYYGLNDPWSPSRLFRTVDPSVIAGAEQTGMAPVVSADDTLYTFANVTYRSGIRLSTRLTKMAARDLPNVRPSLVRTPMIDPMDNDRLWYWWGACTDPIHQPRMFRPWTGPKGESGFTHAIPEVFHFATSALADPQFHNNGAQALLVDVWGEALPQTFEVEIAARYFQPTQVSYKTQPKLSTPDNNGWTTVRLLPGDFKTAKGESLTDWKEIDYLQFTGTVAKGQQAVLKNLRWERLD